MNKHFDISMRYIVSISIRDIVGAIAALLIVVVMLLIGITAVGNGKRDWGTPLPGRVTSLSKVHSTGSLFGLFASHFRYAEVEVLHPDDQWQTWREVVVKDEVVKHQGTRAWVHRSGKELTVDVAGIDDDGQPWTPLEVYIILGLLMGAAAFFFIHIQTKKDEEENEKPDGDNEPPEGAKTPKAGPDGADASTGEPEPEERP